MHELSIAQSILAIVTEHAGGRRVTKVEVNVGHLRQVVPRALTFAFDLVAAGTEVEGAKLVLHEIPVQAGCCRCGVVSRQERFPMRCPACRGLELQIVKGEELSVVSLEVTDEQPVLEEAT